MHTSHLSTPWEAFTALIPGLHQFAQFVVEEIQRYQPDLVIGLAHSGWLPVLAAQTVWAMQQTTPFPPSLRLNFGQEKLDPHNDLWSETDHNDRGLDYAPAPFLAHVLWWAGEQAQWRAELRQMVTPLLGATPSPQRILIIDEGVMDGTTYWPLVGLLTAVYPQATILFSPGTFLHWGERATAAWLDQHAPDVLAQLNMARAPMHGFSPEWRQLQDALRWAAAGTEDGDPHSLHCPPVDAHSQTARLLSAYMPSTDWLRIAPWAQTVILHGVRQAALAQPGPLPPDKRQSYQRTQRAGLPTDIALMRHLWQKGSLTRRETAIWGRFTPKQASQELQQLYHRSYIAALGWGGGTRYVPDPVFRPEFAETSGGPDSNAYWVIPGRLLAGPHPLTEEGYRHAAYQGLSWLQSQGVDFLLDLVGPVEVPWNGGGDTAVHLGKYAAESQVAFIHKEVIWPQYDTPTRDQLQRMLHTLTVALAEGHPVYLYSYRGTGRAALAAAAYLVGQGQTPRDAWRTLSQQWAQTAWGPHRRLPDTERQRRFLLCLDEWLTTESAD